MTTSTEKFIQHFANRKLNHYSSNKPKEQNSEDTRIRTAVFDDKALDKVANIPHDFLILDENSDLIVTGLPDRMSSSSTTMVYREKEELNQGSTLFLFLLAALLFCACVMASTLAFVSSFPSERTEMNRNLLSNSSTKERFHFPFFFSF